MPIADHPNYEPGHFKRVYNHLIEPACMLAGYKPVRADESSASNMIMHDILQNIVKSEMVLCDLSTNNANVFYELGLRQAFNKKTVLITDGRDKPPFDLLGFRYQPYTSSLRIDTVNSEIERISAALISTESMQANEVNSIVKLMEIDSANIEVIKPDANQAFMLQMFNSLSAQIANINQSDKRNGIPVIHNYDWIPSDDENNINETIASFLKLERENRAQLSKFTFFYKAKEIGRFIRYTPENNELRFRLGNTVVSLPNKDTIKSLIFGRPI